MEQEAALGICLLIMGVCIIGIYVYKSIYTMAEVDEEKVIVGLIGVSAGIGFMFSTMSHTTLLGSIYKRTLIFIMIRNLFTLPRDGLFSWFGNFIYVLVGLFMYFVIDNIMQLRKKPILQKKIQK